MTFCLPSWIGLACPTVPVGGVALFALLAVQVRMHPRSLDAFVLLRGLVPPRPIPPGIPPQPGEGVRERGDRNPASPRAKMTLDEFRGSLTATEPPADGLHSKWYPNLF